MYCGSSIPEECSSSNSELRFLSSSYTSWDSLALFCPSPSLLKTEKVLPDGIKKSQFLKQRVGHKNAVSSKYFVLSHQIFFMCAKKNADFLIKIKLILWYFLIYFDYNRLRRLKQSGVLMFSYQYLVHRFDSCFLALYHENLQCGPSMTSWVHPYH